MFYIGLPDVQRGKIIGLVEQEILQRDVTAVVGVAQSVISKTYARYLEFGTLKKRV